MRASHRTCLGLATTMFMMEAMTMSATTNPAADPTESFWIAPSSTYRLWQGPDATRQAVRDVFEMSGKTVARTLKVNV